MFFAQTINVTNNCNGIASDFCLNLNLKRVSKISNVFI